MSRAIRRVTREVSRTVRRVARTIERAGRDTWDVAADITGAIPVIGDVMGATGLVETPAMKAAKKQEAQAQQLADENRQAIKDSQAQQQRIDEAARQDAQAQAAIQATQDANAAKKAGGGGGVAGTSAYSTALSEGDEEATEDSLKKLIRRSV